jgi:hypothetical protein
MHRARYLACRRPLGFDAGMAPRFLTILNGRNLPKIQQPNEAEPSIINEKTIADFARGRANGNFGARTVATEAIRRLVELGLKVKK